MKLCNLKVALVCAAMFAFMGRSVAQDMPMETPEAVKNLLKLVGSWTGEFTLELDGNTMKMKESMEISEAAGGHGIVGMETAMSDMGEFHAIHTAGYDPYEKKVHWFTIDNFDVTHDHVGEWKTPTYLYVENNSMRDGKKYVEKVNMHIKDANTMQLDFVSTLGGKVTQKGMGTFTRK